VYLQMGATAVEEIQSLLYLPARTTEETGTVKAAPAPRSAGATWQVIARLSFDPVTLFRFSAATWNSHRIHYDRSYATREEGYPGLLVHGPFLTMLLAREAEGVLGPELTVEFRSQAPVYDAEEVDVFLLRNDAMSCRLEARKPDGTVATSLTAVATDLLDTD